MTFEQRLHDLFGNPADMVPHEVTNWIAEIEQETLAELGRVASDDRFTPQHKTDATADVRDSALRFIDAITAAQAANIDDRRAALRKQLHIPITPPAESAVQLAYVRDALSERWALQNNREFLDGWRAALDTGDLLVLRVYRDFGLGELLTREPYDQMTAQTARQHSQAGELITNTEHALLTPGQQDAAERLAQLEHDVVPNQRAASGAKHRISHARITPDGTAIDGARAAARDIAKSV
jgi:hypothetical protein